jgi:hypothetical protein
MHKQKHLFTFVLTLLISFNSFSQHKESRKKVKVLKVSYITEKLSLTAQEAEKFWPIYNKFDKERHDLYHGKRNALKEEISKNGGIDNLSEKEAKTFAKKMLAAEKSYFQANEKYQTELSKVISYKKILKLHIVERDFARRMFKRLRKVRKQKK